MQNITTKVVWKLCFKPLWTNFSKVLLEQSQQQKKETSINNTPHFVEKISISVVFIWKQLKMLLKHFLLTIFSTRNSVKLVLILMRKVLNDRRIAFNFQTSSRAALRARENSEISVLFFHSAAIAFAFASRSQPTTLTHRFN